MTRFTKSGSILSVQWKHNRPLGRGARAENAYPSYIQVFSEDRAIAQAVSRWLPTAAVRVRSRVSSSGIYGGQSGAGASFLLCQSSFYQILHHHNHPGQSTIGQSVAAVPSGPSWTPPPTKRIKKKTPPTSGGRSVCIVRLRTTGHWVFCFLWTNPTNRNI
jgi:hypothetical protein